MKCGGSVAACSVTSVWFRERGFRFYLGLGVSGSLSTIGLRREDLDPAFQ